ncbi:MAG: OmpA family protein [Gaiellales bacterium]
MDERRKRVVPALVAWLLLGIVVGYWLTTTYDDAGRGVLSARIGVRSVTLEGKVPTAAVKREIGARAAELVGGATNVTNNLQVDKGVEGGRWLNAAIGAFAGLPAAPRPLSYRVEDGTLTLTGEATTDAEKDALLTTVRNLSQNVFEIEDQVTVGPGSAGGDAATVQQKIDAALAGRVVEFQTGKATLTPRGKRVLDGVLPALVQAAGVKLRVEGFTDNVGDAKSNLALSEARAKTVVAYLVANGVAPSRLTAKGFGEARPVASNATEAGRKRNRRIELKVIGR